MTWLEILALIISGSVKGLLTMLLKGVICLNDFNNAMGVAIKKFKVNKYILINEGNKGTE
jgi:hypothetical protein